MEQINNVLWERLDMEKLIAIIVALFLFSPLVTSTGVVPTSNQFSVLGDNPTAEFNVPNEAERFVYKLRSKSLPTTEAQTKIDLCSTTEKEVSGLKTPLAGEQGHFEALDLSYNDDSEYEEGIEESSVSVRDGSVVTEYSSYPNCNTDSMNSTNTTFTVEGHYYPDEKIKQVPDSGKVEVELSQFKDSSCMSDNSCELWVGYLPYDDSHPHDSVSISSKVLPPPKNLKAEPLKNGDIKLSFQTINTEKKPDYYSLYETPDEDETIREKKVAEISHKDEDRISFEIEREDYEKKTHEEVSFRLFSILGDKTAEYGQSGKHSEKVTVNPDASKPFLHKPKLVDEDRILIGIGDHGVGVDKDSIEKDDFQVEGSRIESLDFSEFDNLNSWGYHKLYVNLESSIEPSSRPEMYLSSDSDGIKDKLGHTLSESNTYDVDDAVPPKLENVKAVNPNSDRNYEAIQITLSEGIKDGHPSISAFSISSDGEEVDIESTASGGSLTSKYESSYNSVVLELEEPQKLTENTELEYDKTEGDIKDGSSNTLDSFSKSVKLTEVSEGNKEEQEETKNEEESKEVTKQPEENTEEESNDVNQSGDEEEDVESSEGNVTEMEPVDVTNETSRDGDVEQDSADTNTPSADEMELEEDTIGEEESKKEDSVENKNESNDVNQSGDEEVEDVETGGALTMVINFISSIF